jgi:hypothetical protein
VEAQTRRWVAVRNTPSQQQRVAEKSLDISRTLGVGGFKRLGVGGDRVEEPAKHITEKKPHGGDGPTVGLGSSRREMRRLTLYLAVAVLTLGMAGNAVPLGSRASHTVTICVPSFNFVNVSVGGTINLAWTESGDSLVGADESARLSWFTNVGSASSKKITAHLEDALPAGVTLKVQADVSGESTHGSGTGWRELSTSPIDVVAGIYGEMVSDGVLKYEATVTSEADIGSDVVRTVTYTITD